MADIQELKWLEEVHLPIMRACIEIGWVTELERIIPIYRKVAVAHDREDLIAEFSGFEEWLMDAKKHEAVHGAGSLFRNDHPLIEAALAYKGEWIAKRPVTFHQLGS